MTKKAKHGPIAKPHFKEITMTDQNLQTMIDATPNRGVQRFGNWIVARFNNEHKAQEIGVQDHQSSAYAIKRKFKRWIANKEAGVV